MLGQAGHTDYNLLFMEGGKVLLMALPCIPSSEDFVVVVVQPEAPVGFLVRPTGEPCKAHHGTGSVLKWHYLAWLTLSWSLC